MSRGCMYRNTPLRPRSHWTRCASGAVRCSPRCPRRPVCPPSASGYAPAEAPHVVREGGLKFRVNFDDYLDTGLFLDQRITRARLREAARGRRFLNLFAYTGSATVYAASGGATATTSVDMSRTYLEWAQRNLSINGFAGAAHAF